MKRLQNIFVSVAYQLHPTLPSNNKRIQDSGEKGEEKKKLLEEK